MTEAIHVMVPAPGRRTAGMLRQTPDAHAGMLLLEDTGAGSSLARAVCTEVELYLHAAGLNTLSLRLPPDADNGMRASQIVGGVRVLRSLHKGKVVLITSALPPLLSSAAARVETLSSLIDMAARQSHSLPDVMRVVRELTSAIHEVAESVVGVATVCALTGSPHPQPARFTGRKRAHPPASSPAVHADRGIFSAPATLLLPLPPAEHIIDSPRLLAQLVSQLYIWSLSLAQPGKPRLPSPSPPALTARLPAPPPGVTMTMSTTQAALARLDWRARLRWADEQWEIALAALLVRNPARGARARQAANQAGRSRGYSLRAARLAWAHLDEDGCQSWLRVCSILFQEHAPYPAALPDAAPGHAPEVRALAPTS